MPDPLGKTTSRKAAHGLRGAASAARTMASDFRRRDLMSAAERLFVHKGFTVTTVDEITRAAGVAKGTFYLYFRSKEDALAALHDRFIEGCRNRIDILAGRFPATDWIGRLNSWVEGGIRYYLDNLKLHDALFGGGEPGHGSMAHSPLVIEFAEMIRAGVAAGAWRVESPELVSLFLFYGLHGVVDHIVNSRRSGQKAVIRLSQKIVRRSLGLSRETDKR